MNLKMIAAASAATVSFAAQAACPGGAGWCRDFEQGSGTWTGAAPAVRSQAEAPNHVLFSRADGAAHLIPAEETQSASQGAHFIEARLRPAQAGGQGLIIAGYADERNWLGFGLDVTPGSDRVALVVVRMEDGKLRYLKRVGREADPVGSFYTMRLDRDRNLLTLHVNGFRTIGMDEPSLPPTRVGVLASGGDFEVDDLRVGDMRVAPVSIGLAQRGLQLSLQAGEGAQRYIVRTSSRDGLGTAPFTARSSDPAVASVAVQGDALLVTPRRAANAAITLASKADNNVGVTLSARVAPAFAASLQTYALQGRTLPAAGATGQPVDSTLQLRFDTAPVLGVAGTVRVWRARDNALADEIHVGHEVNAIGATADGYSRVVRWQPIQLDGSRATIRLHDNRLAYNTEYFVTVDGNLFKGARLADKPFDGISKASGWRFRTRAAPPTSRVITVDDDGAADFRTVQGALNHVMRNVPRDEPVTVNIANGRYNELLYLRGKNNVTLHGESREGVVIAEENSDGRNAGSGVGQPQLAPGANGGRSVFLIEDADMLTLDTLTVFNTTWNSKTIGGQAEAVNFSSEGRFIATHSNFVSEQDTIQVKGYSWFYQSLIAGTIDFIWGFNHGALFEECEIRSLGHSGGSARGGYVVQARTVGTDDPGFVFLNSRFTHGPGPAGNDTLPGSIYLARFGVPTAWDKVTYINSRMDTHIAPAGWSGEPRGGTGWFESNSMDLEGKPLDLSSRKAGRVLGAGEAAQLVNRLRVFDHYQNPVLHADYSDPDAIRVGDTYYMTASSFNSVPGLPLLTSRDMVNWTLAGHALPRLVPEAHFAVPRYGDGVWAPCLRYHDGKFWIFYPDPDFGVYVITAANFAGPWSAPHLLLPGKGIIDPTPLWDDDGRVYLLHAWAKSRAGFNNVLTLRQMSPDGQRMLDEKGLVVIDGNRLPGYKTLEGPKFYKHDGWYYVFAPAGGVEDGWQAVFRSRAIGGPYEERVVMEQGGSVVNGPHQGAWVRAQDGRDWFLHFQDKQAYGRIVHLQPMQWRDGWPAIGAPGAKPGIGNPVATWRDPVPGQPAAAQQAFGQSAVALPAVGRAAVAQAASVGAEPSALGAAAAGGAAGGQRAAVLSLGGPATSDEFSARELGLQWQWNANPADAQASLTARPGWLRMPVLAAPAAHDFVRVASNILTQKLPAEAFTVDTHVELANAKDGDRAGLILNAMSYAWLGLRQQDGHRQLVYTTCKPATLRCTEQASVVLQDAPAALNLRMQIRPGAQVQFSYSLDGQSFTPASQPFAASKGRWVGAQMGLFSVGDRTSTGHLDIDYFRVTP
ncbi:pectinesterase family protein [Pseudoduganella sp. RAF19]|uniref:pectinesterase family protein n=2 Tax=unclassified Pseudoduganella TaxID=2637179 RepID=UPI003F95768D